MKICIVNALLIGNGIWRLHVPHSSSFDQFGGVGRDKYNMKSAFCPSQPSSHWACVHLKKNTPTQLTIPVTSDMKSVTRSFIIQLQTLNQIIFSSLKVQKHSGLFNVFNGESSHLWWNNNMQLIYSNCATIHCHDKYSNMCCFILFKIHSNKNHIHYVNSPLHASQINNKGYFSDFRSVFQCAGKESICWQSQNSRNMCQRSSAKVF